MSTYASNTKVSSAASKAEIEQTLSRYGADQFLSGWNENSAVIGFRMRGRQIKFVLPMPDRNSQEFTMTPSTKRPRSREAAQSAWEQACRQKWRALALVIKAKLEAIESGIAVFDDEFMANIVLPDGSTISDQVRPRIEQAYATGEMPPLLPNYSGGA